MIPEKTYNHPLLKTDAVWIGRKKGEINHWDPDGKNMMEVMRTNSRSFYPPQGSHLYRKEYFLSRPIKHATIKVCGLGYYHIYINGSKPDVNRILAPVISDYSKKVSYDTYDVSVLLAAGMNSVCMELGGGWYAPKERWWGWQMQWHGNPRLFFEMTVMYADNTKELFRSGSDWKCSDGDVTFCCVYDGEFQDGNLAPKGWLLPGYNDGHWNFAEIVEAPCNYLVESTMPPVRIIRDIQPVNVYKIDKSRYVISVKTVRRFRGLLYAVKRES
jgi:alpha-L-rhamnosidase